MKVSIKDLAVNMEVKNKGIELDVSDNNEKHLGDLIVTKTKIIWCKGKTSAKKGVAYDWSDFIKLMEGSAKDGE